MRLIIAGCEYAGTSTIASAISGWAADAMGARPDVHDHWKIPHIACYPLDDTTVVLTDEEQGQILALSPKLKEMLQRQSLVYHYPTFQTPQDYIVVGYHMDDAVYGPLYFGYGGKDEPQGGPRTRYARITEASWIKHAPDTVLVLVEAAPEVIVARMRQNPHQNAVLREEDVERVLQRFREEYQMSLLTGKVTVDTSTATPEETLSELTERLQPFITDADRVRVLEHRASRQEGPA